MTDNTAEILQALGVHYWHQGLGCHVVSWLGIRGSGQSPSEAAEICGHLVSNELDRLRDAVKEAVELVREGGAVLAKIDQTQSEVERLKKLIEQESSIVQSILDREVGK